MSENSKNWETNIKSGSSSTKLDTDAIRLEMGEIQEILRGLEKKGCKIAVKPQGEVVVLVVITPGHVWNLNETTDQKVSLFMDGKSIVPLDEK